MSEIIYYPGINLIDFHLRKRKNIREMNHISQIPAVVIPVLMLILMVASVLYVFFLTKRKPTEKRLRKVMEHLRAEKMLYHNIHHGEIDEEYIQLVECVIAATQELIDFLESQNNPLQNAEKIERLQSNIAMQKMNLPANAVT